MWLMRIYRHSLDDNIKVGFKEIRFEVAVWIYVAEPKDQWRDFVNTAMNVRVS